MRSTTGDFRCSDSGISPSTTSMMPPAEPRSELRRTPLRRSSHTGDSRKFALKEFCELRLLGILGSSLLASNAQATTKIAHLSDTPVPIRKYATPVTDKGRRELSLPTLLTPPPEGRRSLYEAHHTVVDHHGPNPVGGKRGGSGGGDRLRRSAKLGRRAGRVHPEGYQRCRSGRHHRGPGSSPRGRG